MKISVVGSINMDMTVTAERIPQKGETLKGGELKYIPGGKGANQAVAMARLGADVEMFGCVGEDENGRMLLENFKREGVKADHIQVIPGVVTGIALITVGDQDNTIIVVEGANGRVDRAYVDSIAQELLQSELVVLQHEIPIDTVEYVVELCSSHGIKVILNPAPAHPVKAEVLEKVTYLTPNEHEAVILYGEWETEELLRRYPEKLLITQGSRGVSIARKDGSILTVPARKSTVVDTTGAGDTLNGAFAARMAEGAELEEALRFANVAAGLSTEKFGAQGGMPTKAQVEQELERMGK
ncbi:MAG TPA: ribokinase [Candidatus Egerieimonas intestinavium]|uniref:Ribokinase n=1 Tax=Candidatus Egerieimonas intestinavium TaxID=2840777 RepID=A0A9D1EHU0_9FIRM|nr:ribokinase [Candidatus Egerieimonas intestinavium]